MLALTVQAQTAASPERVILLAGTDLSLRRSHVWSNVNTKRFEVHERGDTYAVVTEWATGIAWFAWERSRYEWSDAGAVRQTVTESNVVMPGSRWELRVAPRDDGGTEVEMTLERRFRRSPAGGFGYAVNHLFGRRGWGWYLPAHCERSSRNRPPMHTQTTCLRPHS